MTLTWWDDAVAEARAWAQWTGMRHRVKGVKINGLWCWRVEPSEIAKPVLEACS